MDLKNLSPRAQFLFMAMMNSAIMFKEMGKDRRLFVLFAEETWNSMEMSDFAELKDTIDGKMKQDLEPYVQQYMKSRTTNVG